MTTTERPCFARQHMTLEEYGLWTHATQVSYQSGIFYMDGRSIAKRFSGTGKRTVYRIAKQLVEKGWFVQLTPARRLKTGIFAASQYQPLSHDDWAEDHPGECTCPVSGTGEPVPVPGLVVEKTSPVPVCDLTSPGLGTDQSRFANSPVPVPGHSIEGFVCKESLEGKIRPHAQKTRERPLSISQSHSNGNGSSKSETTSEAKPSTKGQAKANGNGKDPTERFAKILVEYYQELNLSGPFCSQPTNPTERQLWLKAALEAGVTLEQGTQYLERKRLEIEATKGGVQ